jgi:hypothetical protein
MTKVKYRKFQQFWGNPFVKNMYKNLPRVMHLLPNQVSIAVLIKRKIYQFC